MLRAESVRVAFAEGGGQVLPRLHQFLAAGVDVIEGGHAHEHLHVRHFHLGETFPVGFIYEEDLGLGMVDQVMYVLGLEFMEDGDGYCAISEGCEEADAPVGLVL